MKYRSDIDGLRSVAVIPVILFHASVPGFSGGFIGVDIFFVISGYLITTIIDQDLTRDQFSIARFYERRFRRILPALLFVLVLTTISAWIIFLPSFLRDYNASLVSVGTFTSNIYFWRNSGYFDNSANLRPLLHTWSLAVEEQFYIGMPILMMITKRMGQSSRLALFAVIATLSFGLSVYATSVAPTANFFLLPTRSWELLVGAILALTVNGDRLSSVARNVLGIAGLCITALCVGFYSEATPFPGLAAMPPCIGAALLILSGRSQKALSARLLSLRPLVFIGKISYSLYLMHWPVTVFLRYLTLEEPTLGDAAFIVLFGMVLAIISWRYVERPFRLPHRTSRSSITNATAVLAMILVAAFGYTADKYAGGSDGFSRFQASMFDRGKIDDVAVPVGNPVENNDHSWRNGTCFFEDDNSFENWDPQKCILAANGEPKTLLWGDSYAAHYAPGIMANAGHVEGTIYQYTQAGCPPVLSYYSYARPRCRDFNANAIQLLQRFNISTVILSGRWTDLQLRGLDGVQQTIDTLRQRNIRVIVIGQSPVFVTNVDVIAFRKALPTDMTASWKTVIQPDLNLKLRRLVHGADFIDPIALDCSNDICPYMVDQKLLYFDTGHFSNFGSRRMTGLMLAALGDRKFP
ncbi:acyltransferase family protein [Oryzifoliimicrobium ureilyticus]|uniref:acyltransferase family protein n=1 Tax=Oryzifoliimicrobium ureilyticus TaxID=3113724 RepID=UPI0030766A9F